jgi:hypothetical protein
MCLESMMAILGITALSVAGLMVILVNWPAEKYSVGHQRKSSLLVLLCALLILRAAGRALGPDWARTIHVLIGIGAGILFPWMLWILYKEARRKTDLEKLG